MFNSCLHKQQQVIEKFADCLSKEAKYEKIILLGKQLPKLRPEQKISDKIVKGCQSTVYLHSSIDKDLIFFSAEADALISSGLAALLIAVYSGENFETVLQCPPRYLETLEIGQSLTPSRASGLYSIHLRMKQEALNWLIEKGRK